MRAVLAGLALALALLAAAPAVRADSLGVSRLQLTHSGGQWRASVEWSVPWGRSPFQEVHQGVPIDFTVELELFRRRGWWYDASLGITRVRREVYYNRLTRQYRVIDWAHGERWFTREWERARQLVQRTGPVDLVTDDRLRPRADYYVGVRVSASREHLSLPARIVGTLTSFWGGASEWRYQPLEP
ncbi:MAG TPA: DUF4390 domain-containing protein [Gammaproteobacteria bacterium]|nr:DUF4390 domain-containing protein [Gammaproteobacteria bacterium]